MAKPSMMGTAKRNIIVLPCMVKIWLYRSGLRTWFSGRESCRRISPASSPPRMKKQNAVTMYRIPISLWPVSVSQPSRPFAGAQVFSSMARSVAKSGDSTVRSVTAALPTNAECRMQNADGLSAQFCILHSAFCISFQRLQIRQQILQLPPRGLIRRHHGSRLERRRVGDPAGQVAARVAERPTRERGAAAEVGKIGAKGAVGVDADDVVALAARRAEKDLLAADLRRRLRRGSAGADVGLPAREVFRCLGDDHERHVRVLQAAELRALPAIEAGLVRFDPEFVDAAGNEIALAVQVRDPEAVDDVARIEAQQDGRVDGDVDLVRVDDLLVRRQRVGILHFPPPLMPGDLDLELIGTAAPERADRGADGNADHEQGEQSDDAQRAGDGYRGAVARLALLADVGHGVAAAANDRGEEEEEDEDVDDGADGGENPEQVRQLSGLRSGGIQRRLKRRHRGSSALRACISSLRAPGMTRPSNPPTART